jgi:hypothetical protein
MKKRGTIALALVGIGALLYFAYPFGTIYGLAHSDQEIVFVVTDAETSKPIPGAVINLRTDGDLATPNGLLARLVTDQTGRATYLRRDEKCEYISKPFRQTKVSLDLTWGEYTVEARAFRAREWTWLGASNFENQGRVGEDRAYRLQFNVRLDWAVWQDWQ